MTLLIFRPRIKIVDALVAIPAVALLTIPAVLVHSAATVVLLGVTLWRSRVQTVCQ